MDEDKDSGSPAGEAVLSTYIYITSVIFGPAAPALRTNVSRLI